MSYELFAINFDFEVIILLRMIFNNSEASFDIEENKSSGK